MDKKVSGMSKEYIDYCTKQAWGFLGKGIKDKIKGGDSSTSLHSEILD
jgi:hypothetical protein